MASRSANKEPLDPVRLNQLLCERVRKELKYQRLHTEYSVNPFQPVHTIARKPMSWHDNIEEPADEKFLTLIHHAALEPTKKYSEPQTESQEIGWNTKPLVRSLRTQIFAGFREVQHITVEDINVPMDRTDCRFYFPRRKTEVTQ